MKQRMISTLFAAMILMTGCGILPLPAETNDPATAAETITLADATAAPLTESAIAPEQQKSGEKKNDAQAYSVDQAISDNAQLHTIAFSALAFMTGNSGADSFFPPGKVADYFGFQYMRDVDTAGYGHNTQFLSRIANNVLSILTVEQLDALKALAAEQEPVYEQFAYNRFPLMAAFRASLEGDLPEGSVGLDSASVSNYCANLYGLDAQLAYRRAVVVGNIVSSFTEEQIATMDKMAFGDFSTWPDVPEDEALKRGLSQTQHVALMTYASELFSWYKGSLEADVYFCPERHGTYFGGFFLKDYPAMNNPDYFISTSVTGDLGAGFLDVLNADQRAQIEGIIVEQKPYLLEIVSLREQICAMLRTAMDGETPDWAAIDNMIRRYGALDGTLSCLYATRFTAVYQTLTAEQIEKLTQLRNLTVVPDGAYAFSEPIAYPELPSTNFLFGVGDAPADAGQFATPDGFLPDRPKGA